MDDDFVDAEDEDLRLRSEFLEAEDDATFDAAISAADF